MSTNNKLRQTIQNLLTIPQQIISYIWAAVSRLFAPSDDQYPKTGVQPFEGKSTHSRKNRHKQSW